MKEIRHIMGMPVVVEVVDGDPDVVEKVFDYLKTIDEQFSTYKPTSEISRINRGEVKSEAISPQMREVFELSEFTKRETNGYFDIRTPEGSIDPSGLVKGWAINKAAQMLRDSGCENFYVEIAGDIQVEGKNSAGKDWRIGVRNPFNRSEVVKVVQPQGRGIATSGSYIRSSHIWDPHKKKAVSSDLISLTVIGPNIYEADRFATAAYAMGEAGIHFIEEMPGLEGYAIRWDGITIETSNFKKYVAAV